MNIHNNQKPLLRYDAELINQSIPIQEVIERYTDIVITKGNCRCPSPSHEDSSPSAHIYENTNRCFCFGCHKSFTPITIVMNVFNLQFPDACEKLIHDFGLSLENCSNISELEKADGSGQAEVFPLNANECSLIGLIGAFKSTVANPFYGELIQEEDGYSYPADFVPKSFKVKSLPELWKEDPSNIEEMLIAKCDETLERLNEWCVDTMESYTQLYESRNKAFWQEALRIEEAVKKYPNAKTSSSQFEKYYLLSSLRDDRQNYEEYTKGIDSVTKIKERIVEIHEKRLKDKRKDTYWKSK